MNILQLNSKSDVLGALAGGLCLVHCLATPLLFVAQAGMVVGNEIHPWWWGLLDIIFLALSFLAIWWSGKKTSKVWMRNALWTSWFILAFLVLNEKMDWYPLAEQAIYVPTIALVGLHLYNRKYCQLGRKHRCAEKK